MFVMKNRDTLHLSSVWSNTHGHIGLQPAVGKFNRKTTVKKYQHQYVQQPNKCEDKTKTKGKYCTKTIEKIECGVFLDSNK